MHSCSLKRTNEELLLKGHSGPIIGQVNASPLLHTKKCDEISFNPYISTKNTVKYV